MASLRELAFDAQVEVRGEPPVGPNTWSGDALWLGPDEWLVVGKRESDFPGAPAAVDVSANRVVFELSGDRVRDVLAQGCSLDLRPHAFGPGSCAQTLLARASVILQCMDDDVFRIFVRRSFAPYMRAWLEDAAEGTAL